MLLKQRAKKILPPHWPQDAQINLPQCRSETSIESFLLELKVLQQLALMQLQRVRLES